MKKLRQGSSQVAYEVRHHYCLSKDSLMCEKDQSRREEGSPRGKGHGVGFSELAVQRRVRFGDIQREMVYNLNISCRFFMRWNNSGGGDIYDKF